MNNKGQTLIIFVILVPILITLLAVVVDVGLMRHEQIKIKGIIDDGIKEYFETNNTEDITKILRLNDIPEDKIIIKTNTNTVDVSIEYNIDSLFGKIVNLQEYTIKVTRFGKKMNQNIIIE